MNAYGLLEWTLVGAAVMFSLWRLLRPLLRRRAPAAAAGTCGSPPGGACTRCGGCSAGTAVAAEQPLRFHR